jgi:hypothetical protein
MVDDFNMYLWIVLLPPKDCVAEAIKQVQAEVEIAYGKKLWCLHIDCSGEFISINFTEHYVTTGVRS